MAKLYFLGNTTRCQMFGCVVQSGEKTIVIDGGTSADAKALCDLLMHRAGGRVDAWFFTHPHHDHIGAFLEICKEHPAITIDRVFYNFPDLDALKQYGSRHDEEIEMWAMFKKLMQLRFASRCTQIKVGDAFTFDVMEVSVLRIFNPKILSDFINNSSAVYRIFSPAKSILILGDLGAEGGRELMKTYSAEDLYADYTQLSHHGQNGVTEEFYQYIKPRACLWATPEWLWNNDNGGGYNSGPWATVQTRKWMEKLGVSQHYVEKDGTAEIVF